MIKYVLEILITPAPAMDILIVRNEVQWDINEAISEIQSNLKPASISYTLQEVNTLK